MSLPLRWPTGWALRAVLPRKWSSGTIAAMYGAIVAQSRQPAFYRDCGVPDTQDGRFDMIVLHLWMVMRRLRGTAESVRLGQSLFDHFCADMDANLREMGVGDLAVPKRMKKFGEAFYGRVHAYDAALDEPGDALMAALSRNVLGRADAPQAAARLEAYVRTAMATLDKVDATALETVSWPPPLAGESRG